MGIFDNLFNKNADKSSTKGNSHVKFYYETTLDTPKTLKNNELSGYFKNQLHMYCKDIGCLAGLESDAEISRECQKHEHYLKKIAFALKKNTEDNVIFGSKNVHKAFGYNSNDLSIKKLTPNNIPGFSYDFFFVLKDLNS
jgi:hypothetical protein